MSPRIQNPPSAPEVPCRARLFPEPPRRGKSGQHEPHGRGSSRLSTLDSRPGGRVTGPRTPDPGPQALLLAAVLIAFLGLGGCGRKGDPLPPIIEVPETTTDLTVHQEGTEAVLDLVVPATDPGRPGTWWTWGGWRSGSWTCPRDRSRWGVAPPESSCGGSSCLAADGSSSAWRVRCSRPRHAAPSSSCAIRCLRSRQVRPSRRSGMPCARDAGMARPRRSPTSPPGRSRRCRPPYRAPRRRRARPASPWRGRRPRVRATRWSAGRLPPRGGRSRPRGSSRVLPGHHRQPQHHLGVSRAGRHRPGVGTAGPRGAARLPGHLPAPDRAAPHLPARGRCRAASLGPEPRAEGRCTGFSASRATLWLHLIDDGREPEFADHQAPGRRGRVRGEGRGRCGQRVGSRVLHRAGRTVSASKLHGAGNDFLILDGTLDPDLEERLPALVARLCHRHLGMGADGVLLVTPSGDREARVTYWNSDGSLASFCANGTRCAARFASSRWGWAEMRLHTGFATVPARVDAGDGRASVARPAAAVHPWQTLHATGERVLARYLVVGVPHLIVRVGWPDFWDRPLDPLAPALRAHPDLPPGGANVTFVRVATDALHARSFERGVEGRDPVVRLGRRGGRSGGRGRGVARAPGPGPHRVRPGAAGDARRDRPVVPGAPGRTGRVGGRPRIRSRGSWPDPATYPAPFLHPRSTLGPHGPPRLDSVSTRAGDEESGWRLAGDQPGRWGACPAPCSRLGSSTIRLPARTLGRRARAR